MRLVLRWLAFLSIILFLCYQLQPATTPDDREPLPPKPNIELVAQHEDSRLSGSDPHVGTRPDAQTTQSRIADTTSSKEIGDFWHKWSQIIYDTRPNSPAISTQGGASTQKPNSNGPRKPYLNLVRNSRDELVTMRKAHARFVEELQRNIDGDEGIFKGRGVVMVGGGEFFGPAIISIHMLRRTGSTLSVEVFLPNEEEYEAELCEGYLRRLNAKCVVLSHFLSKSSSDGAKLEITHYQLKAPSLLFSSFAEVLLLDSDSIPLVNPEVDIFGVEPHISKGLIIWPDFWAATESPEFWKIAGLSEFPPGLPVTSSETGQLVVNKKTHLGPLMLATYYNIFGKEHYYPLLSQGAMGEGDKETFMAAAVVLNATYYRVETAAASIGRHDGTQYRGTAIIQHLPSDDLAKSLENRKINVRAAFLHSNTPKMNAGHLVDEGDLLAVDKTRLRLLGTKAEQEKRFGLDVESSIWDLLIQTGCELADVIREWKHRERLCERLEQHHDVLFGAN